MRDISGFFIDNDLMVPSDLTPPIPSQGGEVGSVPSGNPPGARLPADPQHQPPSGLGATTGAGRERLRLRLRLRRRFRSGGRCRRAASSPQGGRAGSRRRPGALPGAPPLDAAGGGAAAALLARPLDARDPEGTRATPGERGGKAGRESGAGESG